MLILSLDGAPIHSNPFSQKAHKIQLPQRGFSLIELLVSLLIFSVGILGLISLQRISLQMSRDASFQQQAVNLSSSLQERLRVDASQASYNTWKKTLESSLPEGVAELVNNDGVYHLRIEWHEVKQFEDKLRASYQARFITP